MTNCETPRASDSCSRSSVKRERSTTCVRNSRAPASCMRARNRAELIFRRTGRAARGRADPRECAAPHRGSGAGRASRRRRARCGSPSCGQVKRSNAARASDPCQERERPALSHAGPAFPIARRDRRLVEVVGDLPEADHAIAVHPFAVRTAAASAVGEAPVLYCMFSDWRGTWLSTFTQSTTTSLVPPSLSYLTLMSPSPITVAVYSWKRCQPPAGIHRRPLMSSWMCSPPALPRARMVMLWSCFSGP